MNMNEKISFKKVSKDEKQVEKMSRKLYNNRDKTRRVVLWQEAFI